MLCCELLTSHIFLCFASPLHFGACVGSLCQSLCTHSHISIYSKHAYKQASPLEISVSVLKIQLWEAYIVCQQQLGADIYKMPQKIRESIHLCRALPEHMSLLSADQNIPLDSEPATHHVLDPPGAPSTSSACDLSYCCILGTC
jgi:hypothetical protein